MSDAWAAATAVPVWTKPRASRFTAAAQAAGGAFAAWSGPDHGHDGPAVLDPSDIEEEAFAAGLAQGRATVEAEVAAERAALARLAEEMAALRPETPHALALLLAEAVKRFVGEIVGRAPIDEDLLAERAREAAVLIAEEGSPSRLRLHPADIERLSDARLDVDLVPDPMLAEGTLLIETGSGWIEDGPEVRLEKLRAALDRMEGGR